MARSPPPQSRYMAEHKSRAYEPSMSSMLTPTTVFWGIWKGQNLRSRLPGYPGPARLYQEHCKGSKNDCRVFLVLNLYAGRHLGAAYRAERSRSSEHRNIPLSTKSKRRSAAQVPLRTWLCRAPNIGAIPGNSPRHQVFKDFLHGNELIDRKY